MTNYESEPGVAPVRITTFRTMRRRMKHGEQAFGEPRLYEDFFTDTTRQDGR